MNTRLSLVNFCRHPVAPDRIFVFYWINNCGFRVYRNSLYSFFLPRRVGFCQFRQHSVEDAILPPIVKVRKKERGKQRDTKLLFRPLNHTSLRYSPSSVLFPLVWLLSSSSNLFMSKRMRVDRNDWWKLVVWKTCRVFSFPNNLMLFLIFLPLHSPPPFLTWFFIYFDF